MENMPISRLLVICATIVIVVGSVVTGCTITFYTMNTKYYEAVHQCIDQGGTWIPRSNDGTCVSRK